VAIGLETGCTTKRSSLGREARTVNLIHPFDLLDCLILPGDLAPKADFEIACVFASPVWI
jgi:hypothetical protein